MKVKSELREAVALSLADGIGDIKLKNLIQAFGNLANIFEASERELVKVEFISPARAIAIKDATLLERADAEIKKAAEGGAEIVTLFDERYPLFLKEIYDPPIVLYVKGTIPKQDRPAIAVVGSRMASAYGIRMAKGISRDLAAASAVVVSGMALGIDAAAHQGALEGGGVTLAVLGSGLGKIYPPENRGLAEEIAKNGAVLSELPMDEDPHPGHFPRRNRIISGLSRGVLVVEAREKSGALITADAALAEGRDVYAVPGNADAPKSAGTNRLLKQGAKVVTSAEDILEDLGMRKDARPAPAEKNVELTEEESRLLSFFDGEPLHVDELIEQTGFSAREAVSALSLMELKGVVKQLPGKHFIRNGKNA
jgi:DNA processing protein